MTSSPKTLPKDVDIGLYSREQLQELSSRLRQEYQVIPAELKRKGKLELLEVFYRKTIDKLFAIAKANLEQEGYRSLIELSERIKLTCERHEVELANFTVCEDARKHQQECQRQQQELQTQRDQLKATQAALDVQKLRLQEDFATLDAQRRQTLADCEQTIALGRKKAEEQIKPLQQELEQQWDDFRQKVKQAELYYSRKLTELREKHGDRAS